MMTDGWRCQIPREKQRAMEMRIKRIDYVKWFVTLFGMESNIVPCDYQVYMETIAQTLQRAMM